MPVVPKLNMELLPVYARICLIRSRTIPLRASSRICSAWIFGCCRKVKSRIRSRSARISSVSSPRAVRMKSLPIRGRHRAI